jgi:hypothetical protein
MTFNRRIPLLLLLLIQSMARAQTTAGIYDPGSVVLGQTYGQWSAAWWQWALALPVTGPVPHPFTDSPAFDVTEGQTGPVWFLATPLDTVVRNCNIPEGKLLFIGLANGEDSGLEDPGSTQATQRASAQSQADLITNVTFSLDGVAITNIAAFRVQSPQFTFTAPTPWIFGNTGGTSTSVSDGYFVMVSPLAPGSHIIHYTGAIPAYGLTLDMTYNLNVPGPALGIVVQGSNLVISWPQTAGTYLLESTSDLNGDTWAPAPGTVNTSGGDNQVALPIGGAPLYFRLRLQP